MSAPPLKKEIKFRLVKHLEFLENELLDYDSFQNLTWEEYRVNRSKRRDVERWIENIINSSIDLAKIVHSAETIPLPDTYREIVAGLLLVPEFNAEEIERISKWVRLRNIIAHEYLDIRWAALKKFIAESRSPFIYLAQQARSYLERVSPPAPEAD
jgi:uncharacterized protein YutE (UPF0331/DUF86 family)